MTFNRYITLRTTNIIDRQQEYRITMFQIFKKVMDVVTKMSKRL